MAMVGFHVRLEKPGIAWKCRGELAGWNAVGMAEGGEQDFVSLANRFYGVRILLLTGGSLAGGLGK